jgi:hypothetical protein
MKIPRLIDEKLYVHSRHVMHIDYMQTTSTAEREEKDSIVELKHYLDWKKPEIV